MEDQKPQVGRSKARTQRTEKSQGKQEQDENREARIVRAVGMAQDTHSSKENGRQKWAEFAINSMPWQPATAGHGR
jgi:hypothetical protein